MRVIKYVILLISITILCFSVYSLYKIKDEHKKNDDLKQELIEEINIPDIPSEETKFTVDFEKLKNINSDVVGWIIMEGTQVNYPIVQGENNSYYLNHSYEKNIVLLEVYFWTILLHQTSQIKTLLFMDITQGMVVCLVN